MNGDCETSQEIKKQPILNEALCETFVKITVKELLEIYREKDRKYNNQIKQEIKCISGWSQGDSDPQRSKLSNGHSQIYQHKPEFVWLQAYAINVSEDCDTFQISDTPNNKILPDPIDLTASVLIVNCKSAPGGIKESTKGNYCQVLGQVLGFDKAHGNLRVWAIKVADLTKLPNCEVLKSMWPNELIEVRTLENHII